MRLYLDIHKAVTVPNVSTSPSDDRQASRAYKESFSRDHSGVSGGEPDDHAISSNPADADADLEEDRKSDSQVAQERGIVGKPVNKAINHLNDLAKSFNMIVETATISPLEYEYLTSEREYDPLDVRKGLVSIVGRERNMFNAWLVDRMRGAVSRLK